MELDPQDVYEDLASISAHIRAGNHDAAFELIAAMRRECVDEGAESEDE